MSFGKKLKECRNDKGFSQSELAKLLSTNHSIIGKYERDEVNPTIEAVKKIANALETTVGFLLGESDDKNLLKDPTMLDRLNDIHALNSDDKSYILKALDAMIRDAKTRKAYGNA